MNISWHEVPKTCMLLLMPQGIWRQKEKALTWHVVLPVVFTIPRPSGYFTELMASSNKKHFCAFEIFSERTDEIKGLFDFLKNRSTLFCWKRKCGWCSQTHLELALEFCFAYRTPQALALFSLDRWGQTLIGSSWENIAKWANALTQATWDTHMLVLYFRDSVNNIYNVKFSIAVECSMNGNWYMKYVTEDSLENLHPRLGQPNQYLCLMPQENKKLLTTIPSYAACIWRWERWWQGIGSFQ